MSIKHLKRDPIDSMLLTITVVSIGVHFMLVTPTTCGV